MCDYSDGEYTSKKGTKYVKALEELYDTNNQNDRPFGVSEIKKLPTKEEFDFSGVNDFIYICELKAIPLKIKNNKRMKLPPFIGLKMLQ